MKKYMRRMPPRFREGERNMNDKPIHYIRHEDDETYDEINIKLVERYKTSGLSGDEWRFSGVIQFKRKGFLLAEERFRNIETAVKALPWLEMTLGEQGKLDEKALEATRKLCAQPGCPNTPVSEYRLKKRYCRDGHETESTYGEDRIRFCAKHLRRGDCGLQDSDTNYDVISGPGPNQTDWKGANITESAQVVVNLDNVDQIGAAVQQVMKDKAWDTSRN